MTLIPSALAWLIINIIPSESARILVVLPTPSFSHQVVFRPLTQELARRGHDVVVITTDPAFPKEKAPANLTEIDVHDMSYEYKRKVFKKVAEMNDQYTQTELIFVALAKLFKLQLMTKEIEELIHDTDKTIDLLLLEAFVRPTVSLSHKFQVPVIQISSFGNMHMINDIFGTQTQPLLYPTAYHKKCCNLTFFENLNELYDHYAFINLFKSFDKRENEFMREYFGPDIPSLDKLSTNIGMLLTTVNHIWENNRPIPHNIVYMGTLHQTPDKKLPEELQTFLDSSKSGVIYLSFGTNVNPSFLSQRLIEIFLKVFSQLPYDVLWKWDKDELPGRMDNVRIAKWFPQSDLLKHPKLKLFITQGGLQSTDEAIAAGVPLIGIPMLTDQWYNVEQYVRHHIGLKLDIKTFDEEKLIDSIETVIGNASYRQNVARLRSLMYDQPQSPLERAVWWTEHVLRHGGATHLRAPAANMSYSEYFELELCLLLLFSFVFIFKSLAVIIKFVKFSVYNY